MSGQTDAHRRPPLPGTSKTNPLTGLLAQKNVPTATPIPPSLQAKMAAVCLIRCSLPFPMLTSPRSACKQTTELIARSRINCRRIRSCVAEPWRHSAPSSQLDLCPLFPRTTASSHWPCCTPDQATLQPQRHRSKHGPYPEWWCHRSRSRCRPPLSCS